MGNVSSALNWGSFLLDSCNNSDVRKKIKDDVDSLIASGKKEEALAACKEGFLLILNSGQYSQQRPELLSLLNHYNMVIMPFLKEFEKLGMDTNIENIESTLKEFKSAFFTFKLWNFKQDKLRKYPTKKGLKLYNGFLQDMKNYFEAL